MANPLPPAHRGISSQRIDCSSLKDIYELKAGDILAQPSHVNLARIIMLNGKNIAGPFVSLLQHDDYSIILFVIYRNESHYRAFYDIVFKKVFKYFILNTISNNLCYFR